MKTLSIINLKGGVGKTTTTAALAYLMAQGGKKVLILDNDKQGNISRTFERFSEDDRMGSMYVLKEADAKPCVKNTKYENIDIVSCNLTMESAARDVLMETSRTQHDRYSRALGEIGGNYNYCIIDNPPDIGMNVINALIASDEIMIPVNLDNWSLDGLELLVSQIKQITVLNPNAKLAGVLITNYEKTKTAEAAERWLRERSGLPVFKTKIRHSKAAIDSTIYHKPVPEYSARCGAAKDYRELLGEYAI